MLEVLIGRSSVSDIVVDNLLDLYDQCHYLCIYNFCSLQIRIDVRTKYAELFHYYGLVIYFFACIYYFGGSRISGSLANRCTAEFCYE